MRRLVVLALLLALAGLGASLARARAQDHPKVDTFHYNFEVSEADPKKPFDRRLYHLTAGYKDGRFSLDMDLGDAGRAMVWSESLSAEDQRIIEESAELLEPLKGETKNPSVRGETLVSVDVAIGKKVLTASGKPGHLRGAAKKAAALFALGERLRLALLAQLDAAPRLDSLVYTRRSPRATGDQDIERLETNSFGDSAKLIDSTGEERRITLHARHEEIEKTFLLGHVPDLPSRATGPASGPSFELEATFVTSAGRMVRRIAGATGGPFVEAAKPAEPFFRLLDGIVVGLGEKPLRRSVAGVIEGRGGVASMGGFGGGEPSDEDEGADSDSMVFLAVTKEAVTKEAATPGAGETVHLAVDKMGRLLFPGWEGPKKLVDLEGDFQPGTELLHVKGVRLQTAVALEKGGELPKGTLVKLLARSRKTKKFRVETEDDGEVWVEPSAIFGEKK